MPVALLALLFGLIAGDARAQQSLVSDISSHRIGITSSFTGTELLLFGALGESGDVVVVVRGPDQLVTVRRKERVAGIWVNTRAVPFATVPGFYAVATSRPLAEIAEARVLRRHGIGVDNLRFRSGRIAEDEESFVEAIRRQRRSNGLYADIPGGVTVISGQLFRTSIAFPANVPVGQYRADVYLFRDGQVIGAQTSPIIIDKSGLERAIFTFANDLPLLYGIAAVLIAGFAGWGAAQAFRKA